MDAKAALWEAAENLGGRKGNWKEGSGKEKSVVAFQILRFSRPGGFWEILKAPKDVGFIMDAWATGRGMEKLENVPGSFPISYSLFPLLF